MNVVLRDWIVWHIDKRELRSWLVDEIATRSNGSLAKPSSAGICGAPSEIQPEFTREEINAELDAMIAEEILELGHEDDPQDDPEEGDADYWIFGVRRWDWGKGRHKED